MICTYYLSSGRRLSMINNCFVWRCLASFHLPSFFVPCWIFCILVILGWSLKKARLTVYLHTSSKPFWWRWQLMSLVVHLRPSLFSIKYAIMFSSTKFDKRSDGFRFLVTLLFPVYYCSISLHFLTICHVIYTLCRWCLVRPRCFIVLFIGPPVVDHVDSSGEAKILIK